MTSEMELIADLSDFFNDWIDGDDPVSSVDYDEEAGVLVVKFENEQIFVIDVQEIKS